MAGQIKSIKHSGGPNQTKRPVRRNKCYFTCSLRTDRKVRRQCTNSMHHQSKAQIQCAVNGLCKTIHYLVVRLGPDSSGPGSPQNAKNYDRMTDNLIEPPILLKYPFHQDADDEKAFSGLSPPYSSNILFIKMMMMRRLFQD